MGRYRRRKNGLWRLLEFMVDCIYYLLCTCWAIITFPYNLYKKHKYKKYYNQQYPDFTYQAPDFSYVPPSTINKPFYKRKHLLTQHELIFYQELKEIADELGYIVLAKIRMADLVEPVEHTKKEYHRSFAKIKAKHVDFALAKKENMYVELLIELDDRSHIPGNERDAFVEYVYALTGYKLLRYRDGQNLRQMVTDALFAKTTT